MTMTATSPFFLLPRELRDQVYMYYVHEENGYRCNPATGRLRVAKEPQDQPIDMALQYTCKIIAQEMRGFALRENGITFVPIPESSMKAYLFHWFLEAQADAFEYILDCVHKHVTPDILDELTRRYPGNLTVEAFRSKSREQIERYLHHVNLLNRTRPMNEDAPSVNLRLVQDILQMVWAKPEFQESPSRELRLRQFENYGGTQMMYRSELQKNMIEWKPIPWEIPTESSLQRTKRFFLGLADAENPWHKVIWFWSATTGAISFLRQLAPEMRNHLRCITLEENRKSVAYPETHVRGLIPFMQENTHLQVHCRVDLVMGVAVPSGLDILRWWWTEHTRIDMYSEAYLRSLHQAKDWILETLALEEYGLPKKQYSLIFDGPVDLQQSIWDGLKTMAAAQDAMVVGCNRGIFEPDQKLLPELQRQCFSFGKDFPEAMRQMHDGSSVIHFPEVSKGNLWDVEDVLVNETVIQAEQPHDLFNCNLVEDILGGSEAYDKLCVMYAYFPEQWIYGTDWRAYLMDEAWYNMHVRRYQQM